LPGSIFCSFRIAQQIRAKKVERVSVVWLFHRNDARGELSDYWACNVLQGGVQRAAVPTLADSVEECDEKITQPGEFKKIRLKRIYNKKGRLLEV
jgi:hypothetical protein